MPAAIVALVGPRSPIVALAVGADRDRAMQGGSNQFEDPSSESARAWDRLAEATGELPDPGVVAVVDRGIARPPCARRIAADPSVSRGGGRAVTSCSSGSRADEERSEGATRRLLEAFGDEPGVILGGPAVAGRQVAKTVESDLKRAELIAFPLVFLLSLWVFRGVVAAFLPPLVGLASIATTLLGLRAVVELTDLSVFAVNLVTGLGLGLAIDYSLFMVSRYREELAVGGHTVETLAADARHGRPHGALLEPDRRRGDGVAVRLPAAIPVLDGARRHARGARRPERSRSSRSPHSSTCSAPASTRSPRRAGGSHPHGVAGRARRLGDASSWPGRVASGGTAGVARAACARGAPSPGSMRRPCHPRRAPTARPSRSRSEACVRRSSPAQRRALPASRHPSSQRDSARCRGRPGRGRRSRSRRASGGSTCCRARSRSAPTPSRSSAPFASQSLPRSSQVARRPSPISKRRSRRTSRGPS